MKIQILGTVNGLQNEGMRNVATHLAKSLGKDSTVYYSGLKSPFAILRNSCRADATLVFARANKLVYWLTRLVTVLCKNTWLVCVQEPMPEFLDCSRRTPLRCHYFYISAPDMKNLTPREGYRAVPLSVGIDTVKFSPVSAERQAELKKTYGFDPEKPLVVHVGHASPGRGLEDFLSLDGAKYQRMVVLSGMFEDEGATGRLEAAGVQIHRGYLPNVEQIFQMADVYLFPTRSNEFVISIPLSVMEALSCGTPAVGYESLTGLGEIPCDSGSIRRIQDAGELNGAVAALVSRKGSVSLLKDGKSWDEAADLVRQELRSVGK